MNFLPVSKETTVNQEDIEGRPIKDSIAIYYEFFYIDENGMECYQCFQPLNWIKFKASKELSEKWKLLEQRIHSIEYKMSDGCH